MLVPRKLQYDSSHLSKSENEVLTLLEKVGEEVHKIWLLQVDPEKQLLKLYPQVDKEVIREAAKSNPAILSPYSVVKQSPTGFESVSYRDEYSEQISNIVQLLNDASAASEDSTTKIFLNELASAYDKGDFDRALEIFLTNENPKIEVLMGPIETYEDKLFGKKKTFQFNLRVLNEDATNESSGYIELIKKGDVLRPIKSIAESLRTIKINIRIDDVVSFAGRQVSSNTTGTNLPNEPELAQKFGSKIMLYRNALDQKFDTDLAWMLQYFHAEGKKFDHQAIKNEALRILALHEITEGIVKFPGAQERLENNWDAIREVNAYMLGCKSAKIHLMQGIMQPEEYEDMLVALILNGIHKCQSSSKSASLMEYARGFALFFNYSEVKGALQLSPEKITIDFAKLSDCIDKLSERILTVFESGTAQDAKELFQRYGSMGIIRRLPILKTK